MKKRTEESRGITLGIDIGTQFTYIGYIEDGMFKSALPSECIYGISSTVAFKKTAINSTTYSINADHILYGKAADDKLSKDKDFFKLATNIKEAVRGGIDTFSEQGVEFNADILLKDYLKYIFDQYLFDTLEGKKITQVAIAYPNGTQKKYVDEYKKVLTKKINEVMSKNMEEGAKGTGEEIIVSINPEAAMAADLIAKLYYAQNMKKEKRNYNDIMVIDIGAGTSDIGIAHWNGDKDKYEIEDSYQASENFGGLIIDRLLTNSLFDGQHIVDPISSPEQLIDYKRWIYGNADIDGTPIAVLSQEDCQRMIAENKQPFQEKLENLKDGIEKCYKNYRTRYETSDLEIVVLGNTSTIPPVVSMINSVFESENDCKVHFLDNEGDPLSDALREKGVTNSNFMAFACAFVGGGINTEDINDIKILNADETKKNETSLQVADPTIHSASSIFAINVNHKITEPFFNAWDLISSPFAQEGEKYFLVGPYVSTSNGRKELFFTRPEINKLIFKENASELKADNPNSNFLITYRIDKGNKWIGDEKPEYDASGNMYYSYDDYVKEAMSSSKDIEIVGYGYSNDKKFPDNGGYYMGTIYNYSPAAPVDKKLQIYFWKQTDKQTGGQCYCDTDKGQKEISFDDFKKKALNDGRCNLYS